ncbi:alpha/beta hydrolase [Gordonia sp. TBRC 11910]|uniref:Alpha/beta hydrolase n=1 Tax=Gordonia asplenii TaxID=2725283 RepID=A0A848KWF5_9ACTN|nr:alpha/beta fold hydrolase [Gordonia asplenii]NMO02930.1 alpha/beta hydrolase [Gordonia asplenii]
MPSTTRVALAPGTPADYQVYGELCSPAGGGMDRPVQLLLAGGTYNHAYWDLPYRPDTYSYVRTMNEHGYRTFNIDRIGTGRSSHPPGVRVDVTVNAYVVHQLVRALRTGAIAGLTGAAHRVVLVGHSLGTITAMLETATYHDTDGLIATGIQHKLNPSGLPEFRSVVYPAKLDPRFANRDEAYFTSIPGTRGSALFYNAPDTDPGVPVADAKYAEDTTTAGELAQFPLILFNGTSNRISGPVLDVSGQFDNIFCGPLGSDCRNSQSLLRQEKSAYPNAVLETYVLKDSGHCLNMQRNTQDWYRVAISWLKRIFP